MKNPLARRRQESKFQRAADGSMTLIEHFRELRNRLFKATIAVLVGLLVGLYFATPVLDFVNAPYCDFVLEQYGDETCGFNSTSPVDPFLLNLKIALYIGLLGASPVWLYQLWAFIAPGLHKHERRYTYLFTAIAVPLFMAGATLAFFVVTKSLVFFLNMSSSYQITLDLTGYFNFVTSVMVMFGFGFEFPLVLLMLNFAGVLTAKRMLGWWRIAVFLMFAFAAVVTPTPDPFGMTALALAMAMLYFLACGVAFLNDKRRGVGKEIYENLDDDEISKLDDLDGEPVTSGDRIEPIAPVSEVAPLDRRYDEMT